MKIKDLKQHLIERIGLWISKVSVCNDAQDILLTKDINEMTWDMEADVAVFPLSLTAKERSVVHAIALDLQIHHKSFGQGQERYIVLSKSGNFISDVLPSEISIKSEYQCQWYNMSVVKPSAKSFAIINPLENTVRKSMIEKLTKVNENATFRLAKCCDFQEFNKLARLDGLLLSDENIIFVDTPLALNSMVDRLSTYKVIAFDCEMHTYRSYFGITCLIQLSGQSGEVFVVDTLALWDNIRPSLGPIFADPNIVKIGHSIFSMDIPSLSRDFGIVVVNAFDSQQAAVMLGMKALGIVPLVQHWGGGAILHAEMVSLKSVMSSADWRVRPLPAAMLRYAVLDVLYLRQIYFLQVKALLQLGCEKLRTQREELLLREKEDEIQLANVLTVDQSLALEMEEELDWGDEPNTTSTDIATVGVGVDGDVLLPPAPPQPQPRDLSLDLNDLFATNETCTESMHADVDGVTCDRFTLTTDPRFEPLLHVLEQSAMSCGHLFEDKPIAANAFRKCTGFKERRTCKSNPMTAQSVFYFEHLFAWREACARELDESPAFICLSTLLLSASIYRPTTYSELEVLHSPLPPALAMPLVIETDLTPIPAPIVTSAFTSAPTSVSVPNFDSSSDNASGISQESAHKTLSEAVKEERHQPVADILAAIAAILPKWQAHLILLQQQLELDRLLLLEQEATAAAAAASASEIGAESEAEAAHAIKTKEETAVSTEISMIV